MNVPIFLKAWTLHGMQRKIEKACNKYHVVDICWSYVPGRGSEGGDFYGTVLVEQNH